MIKPDYIIRTNRRSLSLTISKSGELIVKAPKNLSLEYIINFVGQKEKWIKQKQTQIISINKLNEDVLNYNKLMFLGRLYSRVEISKIKEVEIAGNEIAFPSGCDDFKTITHALRFYKKNSTNIIKERLNYFSQLMQLNYNKVSLTNSKIKWGSCDANGALKFNLRLSMLSPKTIDYIIIHELAHLLEFNHSKNFYRVIESIMPDYKIQVKQLKANNFLLQLLR